MPLCECDDPEHGPELCLRQVDCPLCWVCSSCMADEDH